MVLIVSLSEKLIAASVEQPQAAGKRDFPHGGD
jgi:hypothetical protein